MGAGAPGEQTKAQKVKKLGKYKLMSKLGQGGMGSVYKAEDANLGRTVALKVLSQQFVDNKNYVDRFMREARSAAALTHPNIVGALDVGQEGKYYYFTMEFVDGDTVTKYLKQGPMEESQAIDIAMQCGSGLAHAATKHIIHRDIKPDNIMIATDGTVKLTDLGLAKATDDESALITQAGKMLGTPQYASPEQIKGDLSIDPRTDIYSLGMTFYHMLVGKPAFDGETVAIITSMHLNDPLPEPEDKDGISDGVWRVLQKMCEKKPDDRYQTAEEMVEDLELVKAGKDPQHAGRGLPKSINISRPTASPRARAASVRSQNSSAGYMVAGVVSAMVVGGVVAYYMVGSDPGPPKVTRARTTVATTSVPKKVEPPSPVTQAPKVTSKNALEAAQGYALDNPEELGTILNLFEQVLQFKGTREAAAAQKAIDAIQGDARHVYLAHEKEIMGYMALGAYRDALDAIAAFPEKYQFDIWEEKFQGLSERCDAGVSQSLAEIQKKSEALLEAARVDEAKAILSEALHNFPDDYQMEIQNLLTGILDKEDEIKQKLLAEKTRLYKKFFGGARIQLKGRKYAEYARSVSLALANEEYALLKAALEAELDYVHHLNQMMDLAEEGARDKRSLSYANTTMSVKKVENRVIELVGGGAQFSLNLASNRVKSEFILGLARAPLARTEDKNLILGAFYFAEDDLRKSREYYEEAQAEGKDVALALEKLEYLGQSEQEMRALIALNRIRGRFRLKQWDEVLGIADKASDTFGDTKRFKQAAAEIEKMKSESSKMLLAAAKKRKPRKREVIDRGGSKDGLEGSGIWQIFHWDDKSQPHQGTIRVTGLKGAEDLNNVVKINYGDLRTKMYVGVQKAFDFSRKQRFYVKVINPSPQKIRVSLAVMTSVGGGGARSYYECPMDSIRPRSSRSCSFKLQSSNFKSAATGWRYSGKIQGINAINHLVLVFSVNDPDGEVYLDNVTAM
ncbi:MAG: serine/threonine-protein kinase [Planctomycetota bacterium]|jgi:serine/threonine-protein kinase|nr:serine/threonine-protein kinase [Planctomycetota bacterium]